MIVSPTIITLTNDNQEVGFFIDNNEEEENKCEESIKDLEIKIQESEAINPLFFNETFKGKNGSIFMKKYNSEYATISTPPPEFSI